VAFGEFGDLFGDGLHVLFQAAEGALYHLPRTLLRLLGDTEWDFCLRLFSHNASPLQYNGVIGRAQCRRELYTGMEREGKAPEK
jgi:hypothetical protein